MLAALESKMLVVEGKKGLFFRWKFRGHNLTIYSPVGLVCRIHRLLLCRGVRSANECPGYAKQCDGEVPVMLELWKMQRTPSLPLIPGPL